LHVFEASQIKARGKTDHVMMMARIIASGHSPTVTTKLSLQIVSGMVHETEMTNCARTRTTAPVPQLPVASSTDAAPQLPQTGYPCIAQHFPCTSGGSADFLPLAAISKFVLRLRGRPVEWADCGLFKNA
jgi:hypothetical protein